MAVSLKLAGVFSLSLSPMLVAVFVCRAEEKIVASPFRNQRDGFAEIVHCRFSGGVILLG